jgi:hypothetical protein
MQKDPYILVIFGLPGTGKSTVAKAFADKYGLSHLNTDMIRDMHELRGKYDEKTKEKVYRLLRDVTEKQLENGDAVILDGTFHQARRRKQIDELANRLGIRVYWCECVALETDIRNRTAQKRKYSEADFEVYRLIQSSYERPEHVDLVLDTSKFRVEDIVSGIQDYITAFK